MIWRIRSRNVFSELRTRGQRVRSGPVRLVYLSTPTAHPMVGYALGRHFGNAVERNRARRRLSAAFREAWTPTDGPEGAFQVAGSRGLLTIEFAALVGHLRSCLARCTPADALVGGDR